MVDIEKLKEKLDESEILEIETLLSNEESLRGQVKAARDESAQRRVKLKDQDGVVSMLLEKLGVDSIENLGDAPDAKGQADQVAQMTAKIKKLQTDLDTNTEQFMALSNRHKNTLIDNEVNKAIAAHPFTDTDVIRSFVRQKVRFNDDDSSVVFIADNGDSLDLADGVSLIAKSKPALLKEAGGTGSGWNSNSNNGNGEKELDAKLAAAKKEGNVSEFMALGRQKDLQNQAS